MPLGLARGTSAIATGWAGPKGSGFGLLMIGLAGGVLGGHSPEPVFEPSQKRATSCRLCAP